MRSLWFVAVAVLIGCGRPAPVASVAEFFLWKGYGENEVAADSRYGGKYVEVVSDSSIVAVRKSPDGRPYVALTADELPGPSADLVCFIAPDAVDDFAKIGRTIGKKTTVKIVARVVGRKPAPARAGYMVVLEDARVSQN